MEKAALPIIELPVSSFVLGISIKTRNPTLSVKAFYLENVRQLRTTIVICAQEIKGSGLAFCYFVLA